MQIFCYKVSLYTFCYQHLTVCVLLYVSTEKYVNVRNCDLTYNIEAFSQIMEMLWKRLNDHGKNCVMFTNPSSSRVPHQNWIRAVLYLTYCKKNCKFLLCTCTNKFHGQGLNVREKAKQLVILLSSEERLRNERARALKARERFAQTVSGFGSSDSNDTTPTSLRSVSVSEIENARPQTLGEEELQLQLALAMSKEEADQERKQRRSDELRLQMALSQSEQEFKTKDGTPIKKEGSALVDLLDLELGAAGAPPMHHGIVEDVLGGDPWAPLKRTDGG
ncbi:Epsin-2, partial [Orchesella cincta]